MKYWYYPGCSLQGTAKEYDTATRALFAALNIELTDLYGWACCGASAAESVNKWLALSLAAANLALAERLNENDSQSGPDILVPCSACYLNLKKARHRLLQHPHEAQTINDILSENRLTWKGTVRVRHLLDVLSTDIDPQMIRSRVVNPLQGITVAPYYGCQCLRPFPEFDDPEKPTSMDALIQAAGASVFSWDTGARCCGGAHMTTKPRVGRELALTLLKAARGADVIATVCPMCQINIDGHQRLLSRKAGENLSVTVLYLPQLLGLAMGFCASDVAMNHNLAVTRSFKTKLNAIGGKGGL